MVWTDDGYAVRCSLLLDNVLIALIKIMLKDAPESCVNKYLPKQDQMAPSSRRLQSKLQSPPVNGWMN